MSRREAIARLNQLTRKRWSLGVLTPAEELEAARLADRLDNFWWPR